MRTYSMVFDRIDGDHKIIFKDEDDRGWTAFDFRNPSNLDKIADAMNEKEQRDAGT